MQKAYRNSVPKPRTGTYADFLREALADIEQKIEALEAEKKALQSQLSRVANKRISNFGAVRSNSVTRLLIEKVILAALSQSGQPLVTYSLMTEAKLYDRNIKSGTLRSYLHRLKQKGYILSVGRGTWQITSAGKTAEATMRETIQESDSR